MTGLLDHLWQSTLFAMAVGLLVLVFRRNAAGVRFWLWFAASVKFLLPFSALVALGEGLSRLFPAAKPVAPALLAMRPAAAPFSTPDLMPAPLPAAAQGADLLLVVLALWGLGFAVLMGVRLLHWSRLRRLLANASDMKLKTPVTVMASDTQQEPGLVGIWKPVIVLPRGLLDRLSVTERDCILAHELSHHRRRDNLTAAIHMVVETLFWFYPPVWLIGGRMIAERERACDENVLARGHDPETYATGILKVCKFYLQSPLACAAGVTGADLVQRVHWIMADPVASDLGRGKKAGLLLVGAAVVLLPMGAGFLETPLAVQVRKTVAALHSRLAVETVVVQALLQDAAPLAAPRRLAAPPLPVARDVPLPVSELAGSRLPAVPPLPGQVPAGPAVPGQSPQGQMAILSPRPLPVQTHLQDMQLVLLPSGKGDPDVVTCRVPQQLSGSRLAGPKVCRTNRVWADLHASKTVIAPDGETLLATSRMGRGSEACVVDIRFGGIVPKDCF